MRGAIPPLPQYVFMAWCSVKEAQGQLYFYLTGIITVIFWNSSMGSESKELFNIRYGCTTSQTAEITTAVGVRVKELPACPI
jgi:hypothetical protein